jgi:hypothetical protein
MVSNQFKSIQTSFNPNRTLPSSKKIEIKYGFEGFNERNNFPYRNVLIFEMYFELKIRESSRVSI